MHVVAGYPTPEKPHNQAFIKAQVDSLVAAGVDCEVLSLRGKGWRKYVTGPWQVWRARRRSRADLLHAHYSYCAIVCFGQGLPVVSSLLGSDLVGHADRSGRHSALSKGVHRALARLVVARSAACIVKSQRMRAEVGGDARVVPNGVDYQRFRPLPAVERDTVREALGLKPECRYVLFGGDPRRTVKRYPLAEAALAVARGLVPFSVEMKALSGLSHDEVVRYMQACDLLLLTSSSEGSPNVVKEAMAAGMAVVAVDVGDTRERLAGVSGCRVTEADDAGTIGAAIASVLVSNEPREGRAAVASLRSEQVAEQVIAIYKEALVRAGRRAQSEGTRSPER